MPIYHTLGQIPRKRHIAFRRPDGALYGLTHTVGDTTANGYTINVQPVTFSTQPLTLGTTVSDGIAVAACVYLDVAAEGITLSKGLGSRHWTAAAVSKKTQAIAVDFVQHVRRGRQVVISEERILSAPLTAGCDVAEGDVAA